MWLLEKLGSILSHQGINDRLAYIDPVTQGINYTKFKMDVTARFEQNLNKKYVIFYSDIKNFKYINDVYGFEVGDKI